MKDASPLSGRLPSLDGLRGVSIAMVIGEHAAASKGYPFHFSTDGALGVRIFFVISGFIITWLMLREESEAGRVSLRQFYWRRFLRIIPPLWFFLLVVSLLWRLGVYQLDAADIWRPLTFTFTFSVWHRAWVTAHTWSLAVEENFYLIWPAAFVLLPRWRVAMLSFVLLANPPLRAWINVHPRTAGGLYHSILYTADAIGWGCLLAMLLNYQRPLVNKIVRWRPMAGRAIACAVVWYAPAYFKQAMKHYDGWDNFSLSVAVQSAAIAYLVASLIEVRRGWSYHLLNTRGMVWIGVASYSLYIWQQAFVGPGHSPELWWEAWPINLAFIALFGAGSYLYIERPMRRLRHIHIDRLWNRERNGGHARRVSRACAG